MPIKKKSRNKNCTGDIKSKSQFFFKIQGGLGLIFQLRGISDNAGFLFTNVDYMSIKSSAYLIVSDLPFLCRAVQVSLSFLVSFLLLFFFYLFVCIPSCLMDANTKMEKKNKREWVLKRDNCMNCPTQKL